MKYRTAVVQLIIGATLISFSPVFVKLADVGPTIAGFYRNFFGGIFLLVIVLVKRDSIWMGRKPFLWALIAGVAFAADLICWHRSIHYIGPGLSTILGNFQVFFLAAFGIIVLREKFDWRFAISTVAAIAGLMMIVGVDWSTLEPGYRLGVLLGLATAITYAIYVLILKKAQSEKIRLSASANLAVISIISASILAVVGAVEGASFNVPDKKSLASLIAYGVVCQGIGWIVISRALVHVRASRAGLILLLQPTLSFTWDILFFGRPTSALDAIGATLALSAIYLGGTRRNNKKSRRHNH